MLFCVIYAPHLDGWTLSIIKLHSVAPKPRASVFVPVQGVKWEADYKKIHTHTNVQHLNCRYRWIIKVLIVPESTSYDSWIFGMMMS